MATWRWIGVGLAVLAVILYLGYRINRKKATADLAVRLAEAYRARGQLEVAIRLHRVPGELDQNKETAREGLSLARAGETTSPVIPRELVEAGARAIARDRDHLEDLFARYGVDVSLPPLADEAGPDEPTAGTTEDR